MTMLRRRSLRSAFVQLRYFLAALVLALALPGGAFAQANPNQGPGGPILVVTASSGTFGKYYAEILRTEGFNEFNVVDVSAVTAGLLSSYDVVLLGKTSLTSGQVTTLTNWVTSGGNLIAMDPDSQLASLLGLTMTSNTLSNGYLLANSATTAGAGIVNQTIQFHGTAHLHTLSGATAVATLYSTATTATSNPAITIRGVGASGGQAASFAYDLATSIVYTRQGNPAWIGQERDGTTPVRSDDMFFGDSEADWVDRSKITIPQADEQQRLLGSLIVDMSRDRTPLPRFWYFPHGHRAVVVMTGDDHATGGTAGRFDQLAQASPAGCSLADWECYRGTSYMFVGSPLTNAQAQSYQAAGFELGVHINTNCGDFDYNSLTTIYDDQVSAFLSAYPNVPSLFTERHHCVVWSDWISGAKVELEHGIRLDTTYYYWPGSWVSDVPGHFTGSAMPMRFADTDGTLIDVYQAVTQMTDESQQSYPATPNTLLDRAIGPEQQFGAYTINAHTDQAIIPESTTTIASAQARGVPIISARQLLTWLDGRNTSSFSGISFASNVLSFTVNAGSGTTGLQTLLPYRNATNSIATIKRSTTDVSFEVVNIKGIDYAQFASVAGSYTASYTAVDTAPLLISTRTPAAGATNVSQGSPVTVKFNKAIDPATLTTTTLSLRNAANTVISASVSYEATSYTATLTPSSALPAGTYTVTVKGGTTDPRVKDLSGNTLTADATWSFATVGVVCPCTLWPTSATPALNGDDPGAVEVGVKFTSDVAGYVKGIRFYKGPGNTGTHIGSLWSVGGTLLTSGTFSGESASGWQQLNFATPVAIAANTTYVVSYFAPNGFYSVNGNYFTTAAVDNGVLHAPTTAASGGNGLYRYTSSSAFPNSSFQGANYWVDVVFDTNSGSAPDTTIPTVAITSPTSASTYSTSSSSLSLAGTAADNVGVTSVTWVNDRGGSGTASGTTSWSVSGVTLQSGANIISVTAHDAANNAATQTLTVTYTVVVDTTAPTLNSRTPTAGATGVSTGTTVTATFSEALTASTVSTSTIELRNASNVLVSSTVSYNASTFTATLTPSAALTANSTYTVNVKGGSTDPRIKDVAGNALATTQTWTFTTASDPCPCTLFLGTATPSNNGDDPDGVELGVKFKSDVAGYISGIRFYKGAGNTGAHIGSLWSVSGSLMGSATFQAETASGWQQVNFASPIAIAANTTYVASYYAPVGHYSNDNNYFAASGVDRLVLHAPSDSAAGGNGVYRYGTSSVFPNQTWGSTNYWVDVVFVTSTGPDTTAPTVLARTPASGATGVGIGSAVTASFSEPLSAASVSTSSVELRNASNTLITSTVSYDSGSSSVTLTPSSSLAYSTTYTVTLKGGTTDPRIKDVAGNALAANATWSFTTGAAPNCSGNAIVVENCLTGNPASEWQITGAGDTSIQGFATEISVNRGSTIQFKVNTTASAYRFDIYRLGYYGGMGARKITTVNPSATLPQSQPSCLTQAATGLIDCGNWAVSGSWAVPSSAASGIYIARLVRPDTGGASHIVFIVRNDASAADVVYQTSDPTWQAYNPYGGNSLYVGGPGTSPGRAYKVSYNRPFATRTYDGGPDWLFNAEYPTVRWLEQNGYDVSYISGVDTDRAGTLLLNHKVFMSVGHDEYWSAAQRTNVETARGAGVNLMFLSGNEVFWKTRWENSIDSSNAAYRTLVSYKETHANAKIDPTSTWTGTWADPRFSPPADGGKAQNALTGQQFGVNGASTAPMEVPAEEGKLRFWRNTTIASLAAGQVATIEAGIMGYEWDFDLDNGSRPAGQIRVSKTTVPNAPVLLDWGSNFGSATADHSMTLYRHSSGALVFGAGTIQFGWALDSTHDYQFTGSPGTNPAPDLRVQQALVNLFADMSTTAGSLKSGLVQTSKTTDTTAPTVTITAPTAGSTLTVNTQYSITGTAADTGGLVGGVEVSTDAGATWHPATGRASWTYSWTPTSNGSVNIKVRAIDDSGNIGAAGSGINVTVGAAVAQSCPCNLFGSTVPAINGNDPGAVTVGVKFKSDVAGKVTAIRYYKGAGNTGTHIGALWSESGSLLASVTFTSETTSGWQTATLSTPISITANTVYVASYFAPNGFYSHNDGYFLTNGVTKTPLSAPATGAVSVGNGLYRYGSSSQFPNASYQGANYWVDVVFTTP
jgi:hypothetical protein